VIAFHGQRGQRAQRIGFFVIARQCLPHARGKFAQLRLGTVHAQQGREGALVLGLVLAGGLAQLFGAGFDIEDVIADLEGQAERIGETVELGQHGFGCITAQRAHAHRSTDQRTGLQRMHAGEGCQRLLLAGGIDVQRLAAAHAGRAGGMGQGLQARHAQCRRQRCIGQQAERTGLQGVAGEDRGGFVEGDVGGGLATAQGIVVHRRQVVVHQRVGVDQFHRHRRGIKPVQGRAEHLAGGIDQQGAHALAATEHGMAHRLVQALRGFGR